MTDDYWDSLAPLAINQIAGQSKRETEGNKRPKEERGEKKNMDRKLIFVMRSKVMQEQFEQWNHPFVA